MKEEPDYFRQNLKGSSVTVIGGSQGWGAKIAQAANELNASIVRVVDVRTEDDDRDYCIENSGIIFLAAPDDRIRDILERIDWQRLQTCSLLDCATNKPLFGDLLLKIAEREDMSVCSTHPMVRSDSDVRGHNVQIMPIGQNAISATQDARILYGHMGMRLSADLPFETHGERMLHHQFYAHLLQRMGIGTLGHSLEDGQISMTELSDSAPANLWMTLAALGRVACQTPETSAGILATGLETPEGRRIVERMIETLVQILEIGGDRRALATLFQEDRARLDPLGEWTTEMKQMTDLYIQTKIDQDPKE